jgi:DNA-binding GntR family transcriptional regulator
MKRATQSRSRRESAPVPKKMPYDILLARILMGDYQPGSNLLVPIIAEELGVSRTPVREALLRLRGEGLIEIIPRGGVFIVEAPIKLIRAATEVRLVLEEYMAHLVVQRRTDQWIEEYEQWVCGLEPVWLGLTQRERLQHDLQFHDRLNRAAGNETLSKHLQQLQRQATLFWTQTAEDRASLDGIIADFRDSLRAVKIRNFEDLANILRRHVLDHVERIQAHLRPVEFRGSVLRTLSPEMPSKT